jgi:hypothetical protein
MTIRKTARTTFPDRVRRRGRCGFGRILGVLVTALLLLAASTARAAAMITIVIPDVIAAPGSTGSFDVTLQNPSTSTQDVTVGGFNIDIRLADTSRVMFTGIDAMTTVPYIFTSSGSFGFLGSVLGGGIEVTGNDLASPPANGVTITPGQTLGLAHVSYLVAADAAPGVVSVPLVDLGSGTTLADQNGGSIDFGTINGTITIPGAAVPEPGSLVMLALGGITALMGSRKSSRGPRA